MEATLEARCVLPMEIEIHPSIGWEVEEYKETL